MVETSEERVLTMAYENTKTDPEFIYIMKEIIELSKDIIDKLGPDYRLFLKYEELFCHAERIKLKMTYKALIKH